MSSFMPGNVKSDATGAKKRRTEQEQAQQQQASAAATANGTSTALEYAKISAGTPAAPLEPSRWWYDKNGDALEYKGLSVALPSDRYLSPAAAASANPKVWIYDNLGKATQQIFTADADSKNYDTAKYNLGSQSTPYRHWFDAYGVSQYYAPVSTPLGQGYYDSATKAPHSPSYQPAVPLNEAKGAPVMGAQDLSVLSARSLKRRSGSQQQNLTVLGDSSTMGGNDLNTAKTFLGQ